MSLLCKNIGDMKMVSEMSHRMDGTTYRDDSIMYKLMQDEGISRAAIITVATSLLTDGYSTVSCANSL